MPAEWEPHEATWLSWPHNPDTWPGSVERAEAAFAEIVGALEDGEEVRILAGDESVERSARRALERRGSGTRVRFCRVPTNDAWIRDHGPIFVRAGDGGLTITDWGYNAWGGKYPPWDLDDRVPSRVAEVLDLPVERPAMILEGGSIEVNGRGTLLTTESCLLNPNRNPALTRGEIESRLARYLGATNVLWLGSGIAGDDTDGHIDDVTRFVGPSTVVTAVETDRGDGNYEPLRDNLERLRSMTDETGRALTVVELPMPRAVGDRDSRLPASYANYYVGNRAVLVPVFGDPSDDDACAILARLFPGRRIEPIRSKDLVVGLGAVHCLTQQQPAR